MRVSDFDFELPEERIALRPARPRDAARLLHIAGNGVFADRGVSDLPELLRAGDLMVFNDTRVIPAALNGVRPARSVGGGGPVDVEVNLHKRLDVIAFSQDLSAEVTGKSEGGDTRLVFNRTGAALDEAIAATGVPPLPPYIARKREVDAQDVEDYQTLFAKQDGSVAAPTAGLHFTERLLTALADRGVQHTHVTLHVGAGTFLPVKADDLADHRMHAEWCTVSAAAADAINTAKAEGRRVIPVGTTALRTIESLAVQPGVIEAGSRDTDIFITPGYEFRITDALMTNFHLPRSTLFMLVSALAGLDVMKRAYAHAIRSGYRFYSYGDASLIERSA